MTPWFAQAVDPIFLRTFAILECIDNNQPVSVATERRELAALFREADKALAEDHTWQESKLALVAWIDEMLVKAHEWVGKADWGENQLQADITYTQNAFDLFYLGAKRVSEEVAADDAVEMFFISVMLGYQGLYGQGNVAPEMELPATGEEWFRQFGDLVGEIRARRTEAKASTRIGRELKTPSPLLTSAFVVWPWTVAVLLLGLNLLCFLWT